MEVPNLLYITGENGSGKTSILESIYLILTFKYRPQDLKAFGSQYMRVQAGLVNSDIYNDAVYFYDDTRKILLNGEKPENIHEYSYTAPVICYSPSFESILSDSHSDRRSFLDRVNFYLDKDYLITVREYNGYLKRKRAELAKNNINVEVISILTEKMKFLSDIISKSRLLLVNKINGMIESHKDLSFIFPDMKLSYSVNNIDMDNISKEIESNKPTMGAHKDLIYIRQKGRIIEKFQSFGQKKSCLLLLLFYFTLLIRSKRNDDVVLLFDDYEAGMDNKRKDALNKLFINDDEHKQIIMTGLYNNNKYIDTLKI